MKPADLTPERFERYRRGALPPAEMLEVSDLLAREPGLRSLLPADPPGDLRALLAEEDDPVSSADLVGYLDDTLSAPDRAALELRLSASPELRADLDDLRAFRAGLAGAEKERIVHRVWPVRASFVWAAAAMLMVTGAAAWLLLWPLVRPGTDRLVVRPPAGAPAAFAADCARIEAGAAFAALLPKELATSSLGQMMGSPPPSTALKVGRPLRTFVRASQPTFRWSAYPEAEGFKLVLLRESTGAVSEYALPANSTSWQPPIPLERGASYVWEVIALAGGREVAKSPRADETPATFTILDAAHADELDRLESTPGLTPAARVVALTRAGLREEAEETLGAVPGLSPERLARERAALR